MKEDTIVQFVGFETDLQPDAFILLWEEYAKILADKNGEITLHQQTGFKNRIKFISQHACPAADFHFTFKKGNHPDSFPEREARIMQLGGYMPVQVECVHDKHAGDVKLMLFITRPETDIPFFKELKIYRFLNIYEAYYESCLYAYILEFFVKESNMTELIGKIGAEIQHPHIGAFKESVVLNN